MSDKQDWIDDLYAEGANETPPAELDEKIRAAARQPVRHQWYRSPGRMAMLATAASLVIAVSVIFFEPGQTPVEAPLSDEGAYPVEAPGDPQMTFEYQQMPERKRTEMAADRETSFEAAEFEADTASNELGKAEVAEEEMGLMRQVADTPAAAPALRSQRPQAASPGEATDGRKMTPDLSEQRLEEYVASGAVQQSAVALQTSPADLEARCGPLPGTDETREISSDSEGILVTVTVGEDVRSWRCTDGAWIELPSEQ